MLDAGSNALSGSEGLLEKAAAAMRLLATDCKIFVLLFLWVLCRGNLKYFH